MMKVRRLIGPILTAVVMGVLYYPVFVWLARVWLSSPYFSHGFLILPVSAFIAWRRRKELVRTKPSRTGAVVFAVGLATYALGYLFGIHWLWAFSLLIVLFGLALYFGGTKAAHTYKAYLPHLVSE